VGPARGDLLNWRYDPVDIARYLRAMAAAPELAPAAPHLLRSSSVCTRISYKPAVVQYNVFDPSSTEVFRMAAKPKSVRAGDKPLVERAGGGEQALRRLASKPRFGFAPATTLLAGAVQVGVLASRHRAQSRRFPRLANALCQREALVPVPGSAGSADELEGQFQCFER
jgi:hypothetical protein